MVAPRLGWTDHVQVAALRADPSGVLAASTLLQLEILPGMATVTQNVRYVSLFAAARYHRMQLGPQGQPEVSWDEHRRRLEALIAVSTVRHHREHGDVPLGVVGRTKADVLSLQSTVELGKLVEQPAYFIYRGSLADLGVVDISESSDPLFEQARPLGSAWDVARAGPLGRAVRDGALPAQVSRAAIDEVAEAFCLCRVSVGSAEQSELVRLLFGLGDDVIVPTFEAGADVDRVGMRSTSWRFLLELVALSPGRPLGNLATVTRLLEPDLVGERLPTALHPCAFAWRWVAARTLFELGWTSVFARAVRVVREARDGLERGELRGYLRVQCVAAPGDESLGDLAEDARASWLRPAWAEERWRGNHPRDALRCLVAGLAAAEADRAVGPPLLNVLWGGRDHPVPFASEHDRLERFLEGRRAMADLWEELGEEALAQHVRSSLRKMGQGNPDSRLVDFEQGRWITPGPTLLASLPYLADASTRLDVALAWATQLGLVTTSGAGLALTAFGEEVRARWDRERGL